MMNRAGLLTTLATGLIIGLIFGIDAQLDLKIAAKFYEVVYHGNTFDMRVYPPLMRTHDIGLWFVIALVTCAVVLLISTVGAFRIIAGGHFFSDVVFAGIFTFLVIWFSYALIFRWTKRWFTEPRS